MKYAFFPGCVLESAAKEDYLATVAVAKKLGIELEELDGWTCCGASHVQDIAPEITLATNARNIALAEEKGLNLLTVCNTCTLMLREAKNELDKNEKEKNEVNKKLAQIGKQYRGTTCLLYTSDAADDHTRTDLCGHAYMQMKKHQTKNSYV